MNFDDDVLAELMAPRNTYVTFPGYEVRKLAEDLRDARALLEARRRAATTCLACGHEGDLVRGLCRDMIACHSRELKQAAPGAWRKEW